MCSPKTSAALVVATVTVFIAVAVNGDPYLGTSGVSRFARASPLRWGKRAEVLRWGKREPLRWGKRSVTDDGEESIEAEAKEEDQDQHPLDRMAREAPLR